MNTDALERALLARPKSSLRLVRVTIAAAGPLTVTLPDGTTVPGIAVAGLTYTAGAAAVAMTAEGIVPVVLPII